MFGTQTVDLNDYMGENRTWTAPFAFPQGTPGWHTLREQVGECQQWHHHLCIPGRIRQRETDPRREDWSRKVKVSHTAVQNVRKTNFNRFRERIPGQGRMGQIWVKAALHEELVSNGVSMGHWNTSGASLPLFSAQLCLGDSLGA